MVYGMKLLKEIEKNNNILESVVYTEYLNRKSMLEACTDETQKSLLEAQVEVLCEASIKDFFQRIKDVILRFIEWVKKIAKKVKDFFTGAKCKNAINEIEKLKAEIKSKDLANADLDKKIKDLEEKLSKANEDNVNKDNELNKKEKELNDQIEYSKHAEKFQKDRFEDEVKRHRETSKQLEHELKRLENLKEKIATPDPIIFFNATNYIRRDISPQKIASCTKSIIGNLNNDKYNSKEDFKKWLDNYGSDLYILNDETKKRLGESFLLGRGGIDHISINEICREDMEKKASEFKGGLADLFKVVEINDFAKTTWLSEIMDGYEIFAQNLMKRVEKEFDVKYSQSVDSHISYDVNHDDKDEYNTKVDATEADSLFKQANYAIQLAKASVSACGTLIKFEGESIGACRQLCKTIKLVITA